VFRGGAAAAVERAVWRACSVAVATAPLVLDKKGNKVADPDLRTYEDVAVGEDLAAHFAREVLPHAPDAWISKATPRIGYEVPLTRHFFKFQPLRPLSDIDADIRALESQIAGQLREVTRS